MTFSNKIYQLQGRYPSDVILIKNGIFFVAVGKDALFLNEKLKLKCTCFGNEICKVGFLVKSAENYINNMKKLGISFRMYVLDKNKDEELIFKNEGTTVNLFNMNCSKCNECSNKKETETDIIQRLKNLNNLNNN